MTTWNESESALLDLTPSTERFRQDVLRGLSAPEKSLPCKYFYDQRGSQLFDEICELDEYYLTRTELAIMSDNAEAIAESIGPRAMLVELGSGSSTKTRILLDHLEEPAAYVPVDISREHLLQSADSLLERYPDLTVLPVSADFTEPFELPATEPAPRRCVVYFPGSTIGNFLTAAASRLLRQTAELCGPGGGLVVGVDLKKDLDTLNAAYDDSEGVTAEFNRNILHRINRELDADFEPDEFEHRAVYNPEAGRMEIFLISRRSQTATIGGESFDFASGEAVCTEHSHKYDVDEFADMAREAGFERSDVWTDDARRFAVLALTVADSSI